MSQYVATYDIGDDRQREKIARVLLRYGERLQKSVFIVELEPEDIRDLQFAIGRHLSADDEFDVIPVDASPHRVHLRWQANIDDLAPVIVV